jgi:hypothetical protein
MNNEFTVHQDTSSLEAKVASELGSLLDKTSVASVLKVEPSTDLLYLLELYIPQLLLRHYPEWEKESLDGFLLANARRIGTETAEFAGLCILISDQTVTPFLIRLAVTSSRDSIESYRVFLGESGGGHLGISGPPCNSPDAQKMLENFSTHLGNIHWLYTITSDDNMK